MPVDRWNPRLTSEDHVMANPDATSRLQPVPLFQASHPPFVAYELRLTPLGRFGTLLSRWPEFDRGSP